jgi:hypothetical protein
MTNPNRPWADVKQIEELIANFNNLSEVQVILNNHHLDDKQKLVALKMVLEIRKLNRDIRSVLEQKGALTKESSKNMWRAVVQLLPFLEEC